jgi:hypothetical protein
MLSSNPLPWGRVPYLGRSTYLYLPTYPTLHGWDAANGELVFIIFYIQIEGIEVILTTHQMWFLNAILIQDSTLDATPHLYISYWIHACFGGKNGIATPAGYLPVRRLCRYASLVALSYVSSAICTSRLGGGGPFGYHILIHP